MSGLESAVRGEIGLFTGYQLSPAPPSHVAAMLCRAPPSPRDPPPLHASRPTPGVPTGGRVGLSGAGSVEGEARGRWVRAKRPSAWRRHRSWRAGAPLHPPNRSGRQGAGTSAVFCRRRWRVGSRVCDRPEGLRSPLTWASPVTWGPSEGLRERALVRPGWAGACWGPGPARVEGQGLRAGASDRSWGNRAPAGRSGLLAQGYGPHPLPRGPALGPGPPQPPEPWAAQSGTGRGSSGGGSGHVPLTLPGSSSASQAPKATWTHVTSGGLCAVLSGHGTHTLWEPCPHGPHRAHLTPNPQDPRGTEAGGGLRESPVVSRRLPVSAQTPLLPPGGRAAPLQHSGRCWAGAAPQGCRLAGTSLGLPGSLPIAAQSFPGEIQPLRPQAEADTRSARAPRSSDTGPSGLLAPYSARC